MVASAALAFLALAPGRVSGGPVPGQAAPPGALTLAGCLDLALQRNPLLQSSEMQYRASLARIRQAAALAGPTVSLDSDVMRSPLDFRGSGEGYLGLNQTLEFPGRRALRGKIAARESEGVLADVETLKQDLIFRVKEAFFTLLLAEERIRYAEQDLELASDFLAKAEAKLAAGDTAEVEVLRARVEAAKAGNAVKVARNDRRLAAANMNFLLARESQAPLDVRGELRTAPVPLDREKLAARAVEARPEMRKARAAIEAGALRIGQARQSYWPDFDLGLARHRLAGEATTWDFSLALSVPLFFWQPKRGAIAETEAAAESARREAGHLANLIGREITEAVLGALSARDQIDLFEGQILRPAEDAYEAFLYRFQRGEIGGIELIEARRSLMEARRSYADALFNYRLALASLERAVGRPIDGVDHEKN